MTDEISRITQPNEQEPDEVTAWKNKYIRLLADLDNTKKRLARSSLQEVEAYRTSLLRDVLPVADGLELALIHLSGEEDSRNILSGVELIRDILEKFFTKYDVKAIDAWGNATFEKGVLHIELAKTEDAKKKEIEIKVK